MILLFKGIRFSQNDSTDLKSSALNRNGSIPLGKYFTSTLKNRKELVSGSLSVRDLAERDGLNPKYLQFLWEVLDPSMPSPDSFLLNRVRNQWNRSNDSSLPVLISEVTKWQQALWRYDAIGHIGREGGPKAWMNPRNVTSNIQGARVAIDGRDGRPRQLTARQRHDLGPSSTLVANCERSAWACGEVERRLQLRIQTEMPHVRPLWLVAGKGGAQGKPPHQVSFRIFEHIDDEGTMRGGARMLTKTERDAWTKRLRSTPRYRAYKKRRTERHKKRKRAEKKKRGNETKREVGREDHGAPPRLLSP